MWWLAELELQEVKGIWEVRDTSIDCVDTFAVNPYNTSIKSHGWLLSLDNLMVQEVKGIWEVRDTSIDCVDTFAVNPYNTSIKSHGWLLSLDNLMVCNITT